MAKSKTNPKVDTFVERAEQWQAETKKLRAIALGCQLDEDLKWSKPCYSYEGKNVVIIIGFKESCALMFCKGSLLKDPKKLLDKPGENTQAGRWIKFTSVKEITALEPTLKAYIEEAIAAEKSGLKVEFRQSTGFTLPAELKARMEQMPALKKAFTALTPGRQRAYVMFIAAAKQPKTREARIEKYLPLILAGKGMSDEYRATKK